MISSVEGRKPRARVFERTGSRYQRNENYANGRKVAFLSVFSYHLLYIFLYIMLYFFLF